MIDEGEGTVQTTNRIIRAVKTVVGRHNPKVSGSNPLPATTSNIIKVSLDHVNLVLTWLCLFWV
jgi:hypothetical protein